MLTLYRRVLSASWCSLLGAVEAADEPPNRDADDAPKRLEVDDADCPEGFRNEKLDDAAVLLPPKLKPVLPPNSPVLAAAEDPPKLKPAYAMTDYHVLKVCRSSKATCFGCNGSKMSLAIYRAEHAVCILLRSALSFNSQERSSLLFRPRTSSQDTCEAEVVCPKLKTMSDAQSISSRRPHQSNFNDFAPLLAHNLHRDQYTHFFS